MKIFLDDDFENRHPPDSTWARCATVEDALTALLTGVVTHISFDNDLGEGQTEGYKLLDYLEERIGTGDWLHAIPALDVHSANPVRRDHMKATIASIARLRNE